MCLWNELVQAGVVNTTASLRMNDFTRKVRTVSTISDGWSIAHSLRTPLISLVISVYGYVFVAVFEIFTTGDVVCPKTLQHRRDVKIAPALAAMNDAKHRDE